MNDYTPFMDLHPELHLVPTTSVNVDINKFHQKFDYVQDLNREEDKNQRAIFHLLVKDGKFGVLLHVPTLFSETNCVALPAVYDSIDFIYKREKTFGAIVEKNGKFGLFFWAYGVLSKKTYSVSPEYDSMEILENRRIRGIKNDIVTYFDETGHILR